MHVKYRKSDSGGGQEKDLWIMVDESEMGIGRERCRSESVNLCICETTRVTFNT